MELNKSFWNNMCGIKLNNGFPIGYMLLVLNGIIAYAFVSCVIEDMNHSGQSVIFPILSAFFFFVLSVTLSAMYFVWEETIIRYKKLKELKALRKERKEKKK